MKGGRKRSNSIIMIKSSQLYLFFKKIYDEIIYILDVIITQICFSLIKWANVTGFS